MSWGGFYVQCGSQHPMTFDKLDINLGPGGPIVGSGSDTVGAFTINGSFSPNAPVCRFTKQYQGQHAVYYEGTYNQTTKKIEGQYGFNAGDKDGAFTLEHN